MTLACLLLGHDDAVLGRGRWLGVECARCHRRSAGVWLDASPRLRCVGIPARQDWMIVQLWQRWLAHRAVEGS